MPSECTPSDDGGKPRTPHSDDYWRRLAAAKAEFDRRPERTAVTAVRVAAAYRLDGPEELTVDLGDDQRRRATQMWATKGAGLLPLLQAADAILYTIPEFDGEAPPARAHLNAVARLLCVFHKRAFHQKTIAEAVGCSTDRVGFAVALLMQHHYAVRKRAGKRGQAAAYRWTGPDLKAEPYRPGEADLNELAALLPADGSAAERLQSLVALLNRRGGYRPFVLPGPAVARVLGVANRTYIPRLAREIGLPVCLRPKGDSAVYLAVEPQLAPDDGGGVIEGVHARPDPAHLLADEVHRHWCARNNKPFDRASKEWRREFGAACDLLREGKSAADILYVFEGDRRQTSLNGGRYLSALEHHHALRLLDNAERRDGLVWALIRERGGDINTEFPKVRAEVERLPMREVFRQLEGRPPEQTAAPPPKPAEPVKIPTYRWVTPARRTFLDVLAEMDAAGDDD